MEQTLFYVKARGLICYFNIDVIATRVSGEPNAGTFLSVLLACEVENLKNDKATGKMVKDFDLFLIWKTELVLDKHKSNFHKEGGD